MKIRRLGISLVFVAGCAVGGASARFVVPPANAQQAATLTKWEYVCIMTETGPEDMTGNANRLGAQNWELTTAFGDGHMNPRLCFKRPKM